VATANLEQFDRYLQLAAQASEHRTDLLSAVAADRRFAGAAFDDLQRLMEKLEGLQQVIGEAKRELAGLCQEIWETEQRIAAAAKDSGQKP
jgi:predicted  nucleic acid-binding Zn-ribbon protein